MRILLNVKDYYSKTHNITAIIVKNREDMGWAGFVGCVYTYLSLKLIPGAGQLQRFGRRLIVVLRCPIVLVQQLILHSIFQSSHDLVYNNTDSAQRKAHIPVLRLYTKKTCRV